MMELIASITAMDTKKVGNLLLMAILYLKDQFQPINLELIAIRETD